MLPDRRIMHPLVLPQMSGGERHDLQGRSPVGRAFHKISAPIKARTPFASLYPPANRRSKKLWKAAVKVPFVLP